MVASLRASVTHQLRIMFITLVQISSDQTTKQKAPIHLFGEFMNLQGEIISFHLTLLRSRTKNS